MKRKQTILLIILAVVITVAVVGVILGVTLSQKSCNSDKENTEQIGTDNEDKEGSATEHIHSYTESVIEPDCIDEGYTLHTCACGDSYKDNYTQSLGHSFVNYVSDGNATCTDDGTKTAKCERCDETDKKTDTGSKLGHNFVNYICTHCGAADPNMPTTEGLSYVEITESDKIVGYSVIGMGSATDEDIVIPSLHNEKPVTGIGNYAFENCRSLSSVFIPDSVTSIGTNAFSGCSYLENIIIGNGVTNIDYQAFQNCGSLTSITIPDSVTSIGNYAFRGSWLKSITIPDSVISINSSAFYETPYYNDENNWENGVLYIGKHLLEAKTYISGDYQIKSGTLTISDSAFYNCSGLTGITIPDSVTSIGSQAFSGCSQLTSITLLGSVTSIGEGAFSGCSSLTNVTIPDEVTSIGERAFASCRSLTDISFTGTKAQWETIEKGNDWNYNTGNYTIHCTDGDISK